MLKRRLERGLRRTATLLAATAMVGFGFSGTAHAVNFSYATGDLVGIVVENGAELIVNLGNTGSLTAATFGMPSQFGGNLQTAKFIALTVPDNTLQHGIVTFTADSSIDVPSFDNGDGALGTAIANAFQSLDQPSNDKWLNNLNFMATADGVTVFANESDYMWLSTTNLNGYTTRIDHGTDKINQSMPFSTAVLFNGGDTTQGLLWTAAGEGPFNPSMFTVEGVLQAHDNGDNTVTFSLPEPNGSLMLGAGVLALVAMSGRRRKATA